MRSPFFLALILFACGEPRARHPQPATAPSPSPIAAAPSPSASPAPVPSAAPASPASACAGPSLDLLAVIANPSCRISEDEATELRDVLEDATRTPLRIEAVRRPDGRVLVRIVNTGTTAAELPLLVHSALDNFAVTATKVRLAPPQPHWPSGFSFGVGRTLVKLTLSPGGKAEAVISIDETIVSHEIRNCPPNAKCSPTVVEHGRLRPGKHVLGIRTPLYSIREDLEATLQWEVD